MNIKALLKSLLLRKFTTGLLILQLAMTLGLLVNSAILALDTQNKLSQDTGIDLKSTLVVSSHPTSGKFKDLDYYRAIATQDMAEIAKIPGVNSVSIVNQLPMRTRGMLGNVHDLDDPELEKQDRYLKDVQITYATDGYANSMGLEVISGRFLTQDDQLDFDSEDVESVVITESLKNTL